MNLPWIRPKGERSNELVLPQELYDEIMSLPDGADLSEYFQPKDSEWDVMSITLHKSGEGSPAIDSHMRMSLAEEPPAGAVPGTEG